MIVNLIRDPHDGTACHAEAPGVPAHRVAATPFAEAEREVRRRVLRSLADRANPPTAVVFVRTWEQAEATDTRWAQVPARVAVNAEQLASGGPRRGRRSKGA